VSQDLLRRVLNASGRRVRNLGAPEEPRDATFTDNSTPPAPAAREARAGKSLLAAPADHIHPESTPFRIAAKGVTTIASGARVTLAVVKRLPGELFPSGGLVFVRDDADGVSWESKVDGATDITTYHERTKNRDEYRFRAKNASHYARTIEWASVGLAMPRT
jgi:hypothetical protein